MGIVKGLFSRSTEEAQSAGGATTAASAEPAAGLMMLAPDASGIANYRLHRFASAHEAEDYIRSTLRGDIGEGAILFWGLTWRPSANGQPDADVEPVVLISDPARPGSVYMFSFVDLDSAYDFVRYEMKGGLDVAQAAVFWALPARATTGDSGRVTVRPGQPPQRERDADAETLPIAAPPDDEPKGTEPPIDLPEAVRLTEPADAAEASAAPAPAEEAPEAAAEPEPAPAPEAAGDEPAHRAIDEADISNVIDILEARGLRAPSGQPAEASEDAGHAAGHAANGNGLPAGDDTMHVDLSDVFSGHREPQPPAMLDDYRRAHESGSNGVADEDAIEPRLGTSAAVIDAWDNIAVAIDEAIDAFVAQRVSATITWRRLSRALADAVQMRMILTWRSITHALAAASFAQASRQRVMGRVWRNAGRALRGAAEHVSGRRRLRLAWANIGWTLEEAVYAARLQRRQAAARAWANAAAGLAVAARKKLAIDIGRSTAWANISVALGAAAGAHEARRAGVASGWAAIAGCLADAAEAKRRRDRAVFAWEGAVGALREVTTNLRREALTAAWAGASQALALAAGAKLRRDGRLAAWQAAAAALADFADARLRRDGVVSAWRELSVALAAGARACLRHGGLVRAWQNAAGACRDAAQAHVVRQMARRQAWLRLTVAFAEAVVARRARMWDAAAIAIADAMAVHVRRLRAVNAWSSIMLALREGAVAEAQVRIAQAGLDETTIKNVNAAIRKAKGRRTAAAATEAGERAVTVGGGANETSVAAAPEEGTESGTAKGNAQVLFATKTGKPKTPHGSGESDPQPGPVSGETAPERGEGGDDAADERNEALETWRFRQSGRFAEKEGPFDSFDSPPGRF